MYPLIIFLLFCLPSSIPIVESAPASILWAQNGAGRIFIADLDGSNRRLVAETEFFLNGLATHIPSGTVYWSGDSGSIFRANWDGSNVHQVQKTPYSVGLAIDPHGEFLYWGEYNFDGQTLNGRIRRSNLDGSGAEGVVEGIIPWALCLEPDANKVLWSDRGSDVNHQTIKKANLDGSGIETIIDLQNPGRSIAITPADPTRLYFVEEGSGVFRSNLDGTGREFLLNITGANDITTYSLAITSDGSGLYVGTANSIWRANLDGSNLQVILNNTGIVQAMSIVPEPACGITLCAVMVVAIRKTRRKKGLESLFG